MTVAVWIVSAILAALYIAVGSMKTFQPREKLTDLAWTQRLSAPTVKFVGITEVLGGIGLILPWLTGIAPILTPIAAVGLALIQALAIVDHIRHREFSVIPVNIVLLAAALFVAIPRFMAM